MLNKIAFLCVNPWERFLPVAFQSCGREYYQWMCSQALLRDFRPYCREWIETYGETGNFEGRELFTECGNELQFLYVQSNRRQLVEKVFEASDLVIMGLPGCRKEFEKIFIPVLPWKDKIMFLWDRRICRDEDFFKRLCSEYKLREAQMIEIKRGIDGELKK